MSTSRSCKYIKNQENNLRDYKIEKTINSQNNFQKNLGMESLNRINQICKQETYSSGISCFDLKNIDDDYFDDDDKLPCAFYD